MSKIVGGGYDDFWYSKHRYRVVAGGRASKKSTTTALWIIYHLMAYPLANALVIRKFYSDHRDSTYAQLKKAINQLGVSNYWAAKLTPLELIYIPTGQKIIFRGLDDPTSLTSMTVQKGVLNWIWFEEFFQINKEEDFNIVDLSLRGAVPKGYWKQITITMNTWNEKHWAKKRFFDTKSPDVFAKVTNYLCNEFLDVSDVSVFEHLKKTNPRRYRVEGLGEWGTAEGLVFDNWSEQDFDKNEILKKQGVLLCGLDFGYITSPTAFIVSYVVDNKIYILDEVYEKKLSNAQIATKIIKKGYGKEKIIADSAEPKSIDELRGLGLTRIKPAEKGGGSVIYGIQKLQEYELIVHPTCQNLIYELNNYSWKMQGNNYTNTPIDEYNHAIDALRYSLQCMIEKKNIKATII